MGGTVLFQDAFRERLELIRPSRDDFSRCLEQHPLQLTPGVSTFIERLHARGTIVYLVSGGMKEVCGGYRVISLFLIFDILFESR